MGTINYSTLRPFTKFNGLPKLMQPTQKLNGKIDKKTGRTFQFQPCDHPEWGVQLDPNNPYVQGRNYKHYSDDEMMYTVNKQYFRCPDFELDDNKTLMTAGCSHTYGVGSRDHEVWGSILSNMLDYKYWNLGVGGIGPDATLLLVQQFFEEGYVPDVLAVLWPTIERKLIITDASKNIENKITDFIIENNYKAKFDTDVFPWCGSMTVIRGDIGRSIKGHLLQSNQQLYFNFLQIRNTMILLCERYNVKLVEMFSCEEGIDIVTQRCMKKIPRVDYITGCGKDASKYGADHIDWGDVARDGCHFGVGPHTEIAKSFYSLIKSI